MILSKNVKVAGKAFKGFRGCGEIHVKCCDDPCCVISNGSRCSIHIFGRHKEILCLACGKTEVKYHCVISLFNEAYARVLGANAAKVLVCKNFQVWRR